MNLAGHPFSTIDWSGLETTVHAGESGEALWRTVELGDGRVSVLTAGQSYQVGTEMEPHRSSTSTGARLFVVD